MTDPFKTEKPKSSNPRGRIKGRKTPSSTPFNRDITRSNSLQNEFKSYLPRLQKQYLREKDYAGAKAYLKSLGYLPHEKREELQEQVNQQIQQNIIQEFPIAKASDYINEHRKEIKDLELNPVFLLFKLYLNQYILEDKFDLAIAAIQEALKDKKIKVDGEEVALDKGNQTGFERKQLLITLAKVLVSRIKNRRHGDNKEAIKLLDNIISDERIIDGDKTYKLDKVKDKYILDEIKKIRLDSVLEDKARESGEGALKYFTDNAKEFEKLLGKDEYEEKKLELEIQQKEKEGGIQAAYQEAVNKKEALSKAMGTTAANRYIEKLKIKCLISGKRVEGVAGVGPRAALLYIRQKREEYLKDAAHKGEYRFSQKEVSLLEAEAEIQTKSSNREKHFDSLGLVSPESFPILEKETARKVVEQLKKEGFIDEQGRVKKDKNFAPSNALLVKYKNLVKGVLESAYKKSLELKDLGINRERQVKLSLLNDRLEEMLPEKALQELKKNQEFLETTLSTEQYERMVLQFTINAALMEIDPKTADKKIKDAKNKLKEQATLKLFLSNLKPDKRQALMKLIERGEWIRAEALVASWRGKAGMNEDTIEHAFSYLKMRRSVEDIKLSILITGLPSQFEPFAVNKEIKIEDQDIIYKDMPDSERKAYITDIQRMLSAVRDEQSNYYLAGQEGEDWKWGIMNAATAIAMYRFVAAGREGHATLGQMVKLAKEEVSQQQQRRSTDKTAKRSFGLGWSGQNYKDLQSAYHRESNLPQTAAAPLGATRLGLKVRIAAFEQKAPEDFYKVKFISVMVLYLEKSIKATAPQEDVKPEEKRAYEANLATIERLKKWAIDGQPVNEKDLQWFYDKASTLKIDESEIKALIKKNLGLRISLKNLPTVYRTGTTLSIRNDLDYVMLNIAISRSDLGKALTETFALSGKTDLTFMAYNYLYCLLEYMIKMDPQNGESYKKILEGLSSVKTGESAALQADLKILSERINKVGIDYRVVREIVDRWDSKTKIINPNNLPVVWRLPDGSFRSIEVVDGRPKASAEYHTFSSYQLQTSQKLSNWAQSYVKEGGRLASYDQNCHALPLYLTAEDLLVMAEHEAKRPTTQYVHYSIVANPALSKFLIEQAETATGLRKTLLDKLLSDQTKTILLREKQRLEGKKSRDADEETELYLINQMLDDENSMEVKIAQITGVSGAGTSSEYSPAVKNFFKQIREEQKAKQKAKHISNEEREELGKIKIQVPLPLANSFRLMLESIRPDYSGGFTKEQIEKLKALGEYLKKQGKTLDYKFLKDLKETKYLENLPKREKEAVEGARILLERVETLGTQAVYEGGKGIFEIAQTFRNPGLNGKPERVRMMVHKLGWARKEGYPAEVERLRADYKRLSEELKDPKKITAEKFSRFEAVRQELDYYLNLVDSDEINEDFLKWFAAKYIQNASWLTGQYRDYVKMQFYIDVVTKQKVGPEEAVRIVKEIMPRLDEICPQWKSMKKLFSLEATIEGEIKNPKDAEDLKKFKQALAFLININADNDAIVSMNGGKTNYGEKLNGLLITLLNYHGQVMRDKNFPAYIDFVYRRAGIGRFNRNVLETLIALVKRINFNRRDELVKELEALKNNKEAFDEQGNLKLNTGLIFSNQAEETLIKAYRALFGIGSDDESPDPILSSNPQDGGRVAGAKDETPNPFYYLGIAPSNAEWRHNVAEGWQNMVIPGQGVSGKVRHLLKESLFRFFSQQFLLRYLMIINIYWDLPRQMWEDFKHGDYKAKAKALAGLGPLLAWPRFAPLWYRDLWDELSSEKPDYTKCLAILWAVNFLTMQGGWDSTWGKTLRPLNELVRLAKVVPGLEKLVSKLFTCAYKLQKSNNSRARLLGRMLEHGVVRGALEGQWKEKVEARVPRLGKALRNTVKGLLNPWGLALQNDILFRDGRISEKEYKEFFSKPGNERYRDYFIKENNITRFREGLTENDIKAEDNSELSNLWRKSHNDWWDYGKIAGMLMETTDHRTTLRYTGKAAGFVMRHAGTAGGELFGLGVDFAKRGITLPFSWAGSGIDAVRRGEGAWRSPVIARQMKKSGGSLYVNPTDLLAGVRIENGKIIANGEGTVREVAELKRELRAARRNNGNLAGLGRDSDGNFIINEKRISVVRVLKQGESYYRTIGDGTVILYLSPAYKGKAIDIAQLKDRQSVAEQAEVDKIAPSGKKDEDYDKILDGENGKNKKRAEDIRKAAKKIYNQVKSLRKPDAIKQLFDDGKFTNEFQGLTREDQLRARLVAAHKMATGGWLRHVQLQALFLLDEGVPGDDKIIHKNLLLQIGTGEGKSWVTFYAALREIEKDHSKKIYILTTGDKLVGQAQKDFEAFKMIFKQRGVEVGFRYQKSQDPLKIYRENNIVVVNVAQHAFDLTNHASEIKSGVVIGDEFDFYALETAATSYIQSMPKGETGNWAIDRFMLGRLRGKWHKAKEVFRKILKNIADEAEFNTIKYFELEKGDQKLQSDQKAREKHFEKEYMETFRRYFQNGTCTREAIEFIRSKDGMGRYDFFTQMQFKALIEAYHLITERGLLGDRKPGETAQSSDKKFKVIYKNTQTGKTVTQEIALTEPELREAIMRGTFRHSILYPEKPGLVKRTAIAAISTVKGALVPIKIIPIEESGEQSPDKSYGRGVDEALRVLLGLQIDGEHITAADINIAEVFRHHAGEGKDGRILGLSGSIAESDTVIENLFKEYQFATVKVRSFVPKIEITPEDLKKDDGKSGERIKAKLEALKAKILETADLGEAIKDVYAKLVVKGATDEQIGQIEKAWKKISEENEKLKGKKVSLIRSNRYYVHDREARIKAIKTEAERISKDENRPVLICVESMEEVERLKTEFGDKVNLLMETSEDPAEFTRAMKRAGEKGTISITLFSRGLDLQIKELTEKIETGTDPLIKGGLHVISVGAQSRAKAVQQIGRGGRSYFPGTASEYYGGGESLPETIQVAINKKESIDITDETTELGQYVKGEQDKLYQANYEAVKKNFRDSSARATFMGTIRSLRGLVGDRQAFAKAVIDALLDGLFEDLGIKDGETITKKQTELLQKRLSELAGGRSVKIGIGNLNVDTKILKQLISQKLVEVFLKLKQGDPGAYEKFKFQDGTEKTRFELVIEEIIGKVHGEASSQLENIAYEVLQGQKEEDVREEMERYAKTKTAGLLNQLMEKMFPSFSLHNAFRRDTHTFSSISITAGDYRAEGKKTKSGTIPETSEELAVSPSPEPAQPKTEEVEGPQQPELTPQEQDRRSVVLTSEEEKKLNEGGIVIREGTERDKDGSYVKGEDGKYKSGTTIIIRSAGTDWLIEFGEELKCHQENETYKFTRNGDSKSVNSGNELADLLFQRDGKLLGVPITIMETRSRSSLDVGGLKTFAGGVGIARPRILIPIRRVDYIPVELAPGVIKLPGNQVQIDGAKAGNIGDALKLAGEGAAIHYESPQKVEVKRQEILDYQQGRIRFNRIIIDSGILARKAAAEEIMSSKEFKKMLALSRKSAAGEISVKTSDGTAAVIKIEGKNKVTVVFESDQKKITVTRADMLAIEKARKAFGRVLSRTKSLLRGSIAGQFEAGMIAESALVGGLERLQIAKDKGKIMVPVFEIEGSKADIENALLKTEIPVKDADGKKVMVQVKRADLEILGRVLLTGKGEDSPACKEAVASLKASLSKTSGIDAEKALESIKQDIKQQMQTEMISQNTQLLLQRLYGEEALRILGEEMAKIDPADPEFSKKYSEVAKKIGLVRERMGQLTLEKVLDKVGTLENLTDEARGKFFKQLADEVVKKAKIMTKEYTAEKLQADIRDAEVIIKGKLETFANPKTLDVLSQSIHYGAPGASGKVALKMIGASLGRGAMLGFFLGVGTSLLKGVKAGTGEVLLASADSMQGFMLFELVNNSSLIAGLGKYGSMGRMGAQGLAMGLPILWGLSNAPREQRGAVLLHSMIGLSAFTTTAVGASKLIKLAVSKHPIGAAASFFIDKLPLVGGIAVDKYVSEQMAILSRQSGIIGSLLRTVAGSSAFSAVADIGGESSKLLSVQSGISILSRLAKRFAPKVAARIATLAAGAGGSTALSVITLPAALLTAGGIITRIYYWAKHSAYQKEVSEKIGKDLYPSQGFMARASEYVIGSLKYAQQLDYIPSETGAPITSDDYRKMLLIKRVNEEIGRDFGFSLAVPDGLVSHYTADALTRAADKPELLDERTALENLKKSVKDLTEECLLSENENLVYEEAGKFMEQHSIKDFEDKRVTDHIKNFIRLQAGRLETSPENFFKQFLTRVRLMFVQNQVRRALFVNPGEMGEALYNMIGFWAKRPDDPKNPFKGTALLNIGRVQEIRDQLAEFFEKNGVLKKDKVEAFSKWVLAQKVKTGAGEKKFMDIYNESIRNYLRNRAVQLIAISGSVERMLRLIKTHGDEGVFCTPPTDEDLRDGLVVMTPAFNRWAINRDSETYKAWVKSGCAADPANVPKVMAVLATDADRKGGLIDSAGRININNPFIASAIEVIYKEVSDALKVRAKKIEADKIAAESNLRKIQIRYLKVLQLDKPGRSSSSEKIQKNLFAMKKRIDKALADLASAHFQKTNLKVQIAALQVAWHREKDPIKKKLLKIQIKASGGTTQAVTEEYCNKIDAALKKLEGVDPKKEAQKLVVLMTDIEKMVV